MEFPLYTTINQWQWVIWYNILWRHLGVLGNYHYYPMWLLFKFENWFRCPTKYTHYTINLTFKINGMVWYSMVCLFVWVFCRNRDFFTHKKTSPLPLRGCKFWYAKLCSALMAVEQWGFFSVLHLLSHCVRLQWSSPKTSDIPTCCQAVSSGAVTT